MLPSLLGLGALGQSACGNNSGVDAGTFRGCPPPDAGATPAGTSLNNNPVVSWMGVYIELLPDGGCQPPPTI